MARKIDESKPLSDKDREWLEERGEYGRIQLIDAINGTVEVSEEDQTALELAEQDRQAAADEAARLAEESDEDGDDELVDYQDMTNDELREELGRRELSKSGNKDELIARLTESDESA